MIEIDPKLTKIIALAREGIGGEKTAAIKAVKRICEREGLNFDDVMSTTDEREYVLNIKWKNKQEETILAQVCFTFAVPDTGKLQYNSYRKVFIYTTTPSRHIETLNAAAIYLAAYRKERKRMLEDLTGAFVYKHHLMRPSDDTEPSEYKEPTPEQKAAAKRQMNLMENLDGVTVRKSMGDGKSNPA